jgi:hypothetical protein
MDAHEAGRVERRLHRGERLVLQVLLSIGFEAHVVVLCLHVIDPLDGDDMNLRPVADQHSLEWSLSGSC